MVVPICLYGSEIWGFTTNYSYNDPFEKLHIKFIKEILGVNCKASNSACLAELNRLPLNTKITIQAIKYWLHILESDGTLAHNIYKETQKTNSWVNQLKKTLDDFGFSYIHKNPSLLKTNINNIETRIKDISLQKLESDLKNNKKLTFFNHVHSTNIRPHYVDLCKLKSDRSTLAKLRTSAHVLSIEKGRYTNIPKQSRLCDCCKSGEIEDEIHFLVKCKTYSNIRNNFLNKLNQLFNNTCTTKVKQLSICQSYKLFNSNSAVLLKLFINYINECLKMRQNTLKEV